MWEHAGLICFILDPHRSVLPTKLLHSTPDRSSWSAQCVGMVPATTEAFRSTISSSGPANVPSLHVCCVGHPPAATSVYLLLPPGACKHYLPAHALDGNKHGHAISLLLPSLITSITRLRHGTEFFMIVGTLDQVSFQGIPSQCLVIPLFRSLHATRRSCKVQPSSLCLQGEQSTEQLAQGPLQLMCFPVTNSLHTGLYEGTSVCCLGLTLIAPVSH